jgi:hypothetical protein
MRYLYSSKHPQTTPKSLHVGWNEFMNMGLEKVVSTQSTENQFYSLYVCCGLISSPRQNSKETKMPNFSI